jgi:hypothetical protein
MNSPAARTVPCCKGATRTELACRVWRCRLPIGPTEPSGFSNVDGCLRWGPVAPNWCSGLACLARTEGPQWRAVTYATWLGLLTRCLLAKKREGCSACFGIPRIGCKEPNHPTLQPHVARTPRRARRGSTSAAKYGTSSRKLTNETAIPRMPASLSVTNSSATRSGVPTNG